jgi:hypothetical protein
MGLKRVFLSLFILALAAAAAMAVFVVLFGKWSELEVKVLLTTASIGAYSLIALGCSVIYHDKNWKWLSVLGILVCAVGLTFAILTNWQLIKPDLSDLFRVRIMFWSVAMAIAATALMVAINSRSTLVIFSKAATVCLIWITTVLANIAIRDVLGNRAAELLLIKFLTVSSILGLLGVVVTPILNKLPPVKPPSR